MVLTESGNNAAPVVGVEDNKENGKAFSPIGKIIEIPSPTEGQDEKKTFDKEESSVRTVNSTSSPPLANKIIISNEAKEEEEEEKPLPPISQLVSQDLWSDDVEVVKEALRNLIQLTFQHNKEKENRNAVTWMGGHLAILKVVSKYEDDEVVAAHGLRLLQILATLPDLRSVLAAIGGIEFVIARMKASNDLHVKAYGCGALQNIVADSLLNKKRLVASGGMLQICLAMKAFPHSEELQRFGCGAILNLASGSTQALQDKLVEEDGLVVLAMLMGHHRYKPDLRKKAIEAFKQLL